MKRTAVIFYFCLLVACSSQATVSQCTPGQVVPCACVGGTSGAQMCSSSGAFGACMCPDASTRDASVDVAPDMVAEVAVDVPGAPVDATIDVPQEITVDVADAPPDAGRDVPLDLASDGQCPGATMCGSICTDTSRDVHNCGRCGNDCATLTGIVVGAVRCVAGACDVSDACLPSRAHCSINPQDGCETDVTTPSRCGGCSTRCEEPTPLCSLMVDSMGGRRYSCVSGCSTTTPTRCAMSCVDLLSDPTHCGDCATACPVPTNGNATCTRALCGILCNTGYHACGTMCASNASPGSCGASCTPCAVRANATAVCDGAGCGFTCDTGYADCDRNAANGCEVDLRTSMTNCGACGSACSAPMNATAATCSAAMCGFTCTTGYVRSGDACVILPRGMCPVPTGAPMSTVIDESFTSGVLNTSLFQTVGSVSISGGVLIMSASTRSQVSTIQFSAPAVVEVRGRLAQTSTSYDHFWISRCDGTVSPAPLSSWSFSSHWENTSVQVQVSGISSDRIDTAFDARTYHTYRFVLGESSQENYIDGTLVRTHSFSIPRGTAWVFSATTYQSFTNAEIDSITVQSQATCGLCSSPPSP
jgi:hypothetical protein